MTRTRGGDKRSSWLTFQRRLFLIRRLVRGPATAKTLIADARAAFDSEIYPSDARTALRHDFSALRQEFDCTIRLGPGNQYHLDDFGRLALLDLADEELETLAFLFHTFRDGPLPNASQVDALLDRVVGLLPPERRTQLLRITRHVRFDHPQPTVERDAETMRLLKRAMRQRMIRFCYRSLYTQDGCTEHHHVAPYDLFFRDGHVYLHGYCHESTLAAILQRYVLYRVDRIEPGTLELLPTQLPPGQPPQRRYTVRYTLGPVVARQRDIALWFPQSVVTFHDDGSATVDAETSDLWQARQIVLRYREHCLVHEPPELVAMIRESIERMTTLYAPAASLEVGA